MSDLSETAPAFVAMAHRTVWASVATVDTHGRPRAYAQAGVTWWLESLHARRADRAGLLARVRAGPPAL